MKLKVIVVGPKACGKTQISNFLLGQTDSLVIGNISPTAGCRILEGEVKGKGNNPISVELWDTSGDPRYEACWRAVMAEADGVILIYNPDAPAQEQQLSDWFDFFVRKNGLKDEQCMIFAHRNINATERFRAPPIFSKVSASVTTTQSGEDMKAMFENFIKEVANVRQRK
eukprot:gene11468-12828_t